MPDHQQINPQRVLACVLCQQRKVKCDRKFPCANCIKHNVKCVPATKTKPRRRRFPERELLDRLRRYEDLMRQHNVRFDALHPDHEPTPESYDSEHEDRDVQSSASPSTDIKKEDDHDSATPIFSKLGDEHFMSEEMRDTLIKKAWDHLMHNDDNILFGTSASGVDLSTFHPEPVHIFRLWQTYLDNVNPLLRITHTPTLQVRIIEAASNISAISPALEALMFSIYCIAVLSLTEQECINTLGMTKDNLTIKFRFGCQQALLNAGVLRTDEMDCLSALYLYFLSASALTHPRSLSSMLGMATRIAYRMGLHTENTNEKYSILEAEMRRRLWWALIMFDSRICELSNSRTTLLDSSWDCLLPLNVSDSDLREEMKDRPVEQTKVSENIFAVVRAEMGQFLRQSPVYLNLINPRLNLMSKLGANEDRSMDALNRKIETEYLRHCNQETPIHMITAWTARIYTSKYIIVQNTVGATSSGDPGMTTLEHAFRMLEYDTKIHTTPAVQGFLWYTQIYFPFPAYLHIVRNLRHDTPQDITDRGWQLLYENFNARFASMKADGDSSFKALAGITLKAWNALEVTYRETGKNVETPLVVTCIKEKIAQSNGNNDPVGFDLNSYMLPTPFTFPTYNSQFQLFDDLQTSTAGMTLGTASTDPTNTMNLGNMDWTTGLQGQW